jgi:hypothetical protein
MKRFFGLLLCGLLTCTSSVAEEVLSETKTWCFGRFLVDAPREIILTGQWGEYYTKAFETGRGAEEFQSKVNTTIRERKNATHEYDDKYERSEYPEGGKEQIIVSKHESIGGGMSYKLDVFALRKLNYFFYFTSEGYDEDRIDRVVASYRDKILPALRFRPDNEIPKEPGFCFKDGFIALDGGEVSGRNEQASLYFDLKDHPDVRISIRSAVRFVEAESLIELHDAVKGDMESWVQVDGVGKREVNGLQGEERLLSGTKDGFTEYIYKWQTLGEIGNPLKPELILSIEVGSPKASASLEKEQVRALYETILKSLRFRPVEAPKPEAKAPQRLATGDHCPKSGMWRCVETNKIMHIYEGQNMPWVMYEKPATGWLDQLRGIETQYSHTGPGTFEWVSERRKDTEGGRILLPSCASRMPPSSRRRAGLASLREGGGRRSLTEGERGGSGLQTRRDKHEKILWSVALRAVDGRGKRPPKILLEGFKNSPRRF